MEKLTDNFFDKVMPIYAMLVCIACFICLAALGFGAAVGLVMRALSQ